MSTFTWCAAEAHFPLASQALHAQDIEAAAKAVEARRAELATSMKAVEAQFKTAREQLASSPISEAEKAKRLEQLQDKEDEVRERGSWSVCGLQLRKLLYDLVGDSLEAKTCETDANLQPSRHSRAAPR
jgi:hypothetical protein